MRGFIILAAAALSLSACAPSNGSSVDYQARWDTERAARQTTAIDPSYNRAAVVPPSPAEMQAERDRERIMQAAALECRYQATSATFNLSNDGSLFYGALNQRFQENKLYGQCMEAQAARMGY